MATTTTPSIETFLANIAEANAINAGRGSNLYYNQSILAKHDRFGTAVVQTNAETIGLTFFTRPQLNMTTESVRQDRTLSLLDTMDPMNFQFAIRCNLDTRFGRSPEVAPIAATSPWLNPESPFNIPLGNTIIGMSGWPDFNLEYETTDPGYFGEDMTMVRGSDRGRRTYDLTCTFRDIQGSFILSYLWYWQHAMALQMEGAIVAYPEDREANRLNYTCSIYRLILDPSHRTITKWAKATGCYPVSVPIGESYNFGPEDHYTHTAQNFTVPFKVNHVAYMDPSDLRAFNTLVERYAGTNLLKDSSRTPAPVTAAANFSGLPYIDLYTGTNELMFLAKKSELVNPNAVVAQQLANLAGSYDSGLIAKYTTTSANTQKA